MQGSAKTRLDDAHAAMVRQLPAAPVQLSIEALERKITTLAARLNADTHRWLCLIREFDQRGGWVGWGMQSCAQWLAWRCGTTERTAREQLRVAHALESLPTIDQAFRRGELSYSKVRAVTRVAKPHNEEEMLKVARSSPAAHLERLTRGYRRLEALEALEENNARHADRRLHFAYEQDGSLVIRLQLPPEEGALVLKALDAALDALRREERETDRGSAEPSTKSGLAASSGEGGAVESLLDRGSAEPPAQESGPAKGSKEGGFVESLPDHGSAEPCQSGGSLQPSEDGGSPNPSQTGGSAEPPAQEAATTSFLDSFRAPARRADAWVRIAESFLARGSAPLSGGERYQVIVHADATALGGADEAARCELEDGGPIAAETARRIACDASLIRLLQDAEGEPLDVGRRRRSIPPAIRRALAARDKGCRFPGCTRTRHVDGHHVKHWARGGETKLDNLVLLCRFHHRQVHEGGFGVAVDPGGGFVFRRPDGVRLEHVPRAASIAVSDREETETRITQ